VARRRRPHQLRSQALADALLLDSGALSKGAAGDARVRAELAVAEEVGAAVQVSSVTLAEVLRGHPRDARVHSLLSGVDEKALSPELGRAAGELLGRTRRDDTVDAIVAMTANAAGARVRLLTGDPGDLRALTTDMTGVTVVPI
jgi:hypothetical protein